MLAVVWGLVGRRGKKDILWSARMQTAVLYCRMCVLMRCSRHLFSIVCEQLWASELLIDNDYNNDAKLSFAEFIPW